VTALQFTDAGFDLYVTYDRLHCLPDPRAALAELVRVLGRVGPARHVMRYRSRPVRGCPDRGNRRAGVFGNAPHAGQIEHWLKKFGLDIVTLERTGAVEFFEARLPFRN
jgi:ubiquinone/menaquinone biosynthesis C-methylase UbiE